MFLPIGDTPNPPRFVPYVNYALLAANVLVYLLVSVPLSLEAPGALSTEALKVVQAMGRSPQTAYDVFVFTHGFKPGAFSVTDLFSAMFLHGSFLHLAGNMLFLWIYGDNVEHHLGRVPYLLAYLATGIAATLTFALFDPDSLVPMVGASGAISGVLGYYFLLFPRNRIKVFVFLFPIIFNVFLVPARLVLGFYLVFDNLIPVLFAAQTGVAYGAHIGGFVAGLGLAYFGERVRLPWRPSGRAVPRSRRRSGTHGGASWSDPGTGSPSEPGLDLDDLLDALEANHSGQVVRVASELPPKVLGRLTLNDQLRTADLLDDAGHRSAATHLLRQAAARHQTDREALSRIYLTLGLLRLRSGQEPTAYQHLLNVLDLSPNSATARRAEEALKRFPSYRPRRG